MLPAAIDLTVLAHSACYAGKIGCDAEIRRGKVFLEPCKVGGSGLKEHHDLIDCVNDVVYLVGNRVYDITLSPGYQKHSLEPSDQGHWMLPCSDFPDHYTAGITDSAPRVFTLGDFFVENPTNNVYNIDVQKDEANDIGNSCAESPVAAPPQSSVRRM